MRGLLSILSLFRYLLDKSNNTGALLSDFLSHYIKIDLKSHFDVKKSRFPPFLCNVIMVMDVTTLLNVYTTSGLSVLL